MSPLALLLACVSPSADGPDVRFPIGGTVVTVDPLLTTESWTDSDRSASKFGCSVASAGDVNGDGYADVLIGAQYYDDGSPNEGAAFVYLGSASGLATSPAWVAESDQVNAYFGNSVASAGDVNGDGFGDVIVGANRYDVGETDEGAAFVYLGSASGLGSTPAWTAVSGQREAFFGASVASAGDVDGDGYSDVIVGANLYDGESADEGRAYVYLGSPSGLGASPAWTADPADRELAFLGGSVASAGDVDGDGYGDVIVGAPNDQDDALEEGRAYVYLGSSTGLATSPAWITSSDQDTSTYGGAVASAGDVNGDGYGDVVVGAHRYDNEAIKEGRAYVYLGSPTGLAPTAAWIADPADADGAQFGYAVASAGDVDGDGYGDLLVSATRHDASTPEDSRAYLYLGSEAGVATSPAWNVASDQTNAWYGDSLASAGDVNGDGHADVIVGAPGYVYDAEWDGRAYLYLGAGPEVDDTADSATDTAPPDTANTTDKVDDCGCATSPSGAPLLGLLVVLRRRQNPRNTRVS